MFVFGKWRKTAKSQFHVRLHVAALAAAILVVWTLLSPPIAHAADTLASLRTEAKTFLAPCPDAPDPEARFCKGDQKFFVDSYACAFTGNYFSEKYVAVQLSFAGNEVIERSDIMTCAWFRVLANHNIHATNQDVSMMDAACLLLWPQSRAIAKSRAAAILARIDAFNATPAASAACP